MQAIHTIGSRAARLTWLHWVLPGVAILLSLGWLAVRTLEPPAIAHRVLVSQKGREFNPGSITVHLGDQVRIVNDDEDLTHHAYISSSAFSFDSGDQQPGHNVDITFAKDGTFNVLCGIHPKMRLTVRVRPAQPN